MFQQQPMKMASAESLCETEMDPDFSLLTIGTHNNCDSVTHVIKVPYVLSWLAEGKFTGLSNCKASINCRSSRSRTSGRATTDRISLSRTGLSAP